MITIGDMKIFDLKELSREFGLSIATFRRYIKSGRIAGQKVGNRWYISEKALRDFFSQSYPGQAPAEKTNKE